MPGSRPVIYPEVLLPLLPALVSLRDVDDVEGFVNATINDEFGRRRQVDLTLEEREELVLEGITLLYELERVYEPRRGNHKQDGRFSGFAAFYLPKRLAERWHQRHPEHRYVTNPETGKREYIYLKRSLSLDALRAERSEDGGSPDSIDGRLLSQKKWAPVARAA